MAIQYYMRAYKTTPTAGYVDWVVNDQPDSTGVYSGFNPADLINITINKIVQSKTDNWLQPDQGYITADGYFFHLNAFDQLHAGAAFPVTPTVIPVPSGLVGIAVTRGGTTDASGLLLPGASTNFFSTLCWDEAGARWRFVRNTNGDHVTLGSTQDVSMGNILSDGYLKIDGYIAVGINPAQSGIIRIPNNQWIEARRASGTTDGYLIRLDNTDRVQIGTLADNPVVYIPGNIRVDEYVRDGGANPALSGFVRNSNNTNIEVARDSTNFNDHVLTATNNIAIDTNTGSTLNNNLAIGNANATFGNIVYNTATARAHQFQINSITLAEIGTTGNTPTNDANNFIRFSAATVLPTIYQFHATSGTGQTFNIQSQSTTAASQTGGIISLTSGSAPASGFGGTVDLLTGNGASFPVAATLKMRIHPTVAPTPANSNSFQFFANLFRIDSAQILPIIRQDSVSAPSAQATALTLRAQDNTGATSTGGNLLLSAGSGTTSAGNVIITTGNTNKIIVSPTLTTILGNLLVDGVSTNISSTVVEIEDRVINLNSSANQFPGTIIGTPTQLTGFAIDRGSPDGTVKRDYYGLLWSENDGYWRLAINTDGYTAQNTLSGTLPLLTSAVMAQPSAVVPVDATKIPTVGGFRSLNNTVHSASRNIAATQDLILVSTDATDHLIWGAATQNAGHIFRTSTGTIYDFRVADVSTYTLTPQSTGTTTLQATSGVTALVYSHQTTGAAAGATTSLQAQTAATTGGNLVLSSGQGSVDANDGYVSIETGNNDRIIVRNAFTEFRDNSGEALRVTYVSAGTTQITYASTVTAAQFNQTTTGSATGANMTFQAQNAATTGGNIVVTSGTGTTAGNTQLQTGGVDRVVVHPTFTEFRDVAEALRITPVSAGTTQATFAATVTAVSINQTQTASTPSANWTIQSQVTTAASGVGGNISVIAGNATGTTSTGGNAIVTSGTGTTVAGNTQLQTGGIDRVVVHPTFTEFRDAAEAYRITPISAGTTTFEAASTVTSMVYRQADLLTASGTGATTTIQAQDATGATSTGGDLEITTGSGTSDNGNMNLQVGGVTTARLVTNKFVFSAGKRRHITNVTGTYTILASDDYLAITTLAAPFTIDLPAAPVAGDEYVIKDTTGNAGASNVTVDGNGNNIDGIGTFLLSQPYAAATFTFAGGQWSVS